MGKVGGTGKQAVSLFVGYAEKGYTVLQNSPSSGEQADRKTADEESRESIRVQEIRDDNSC